MLSNHVDTGATTRAWTMAGPAVEGSGFPSRRGESNP